MRKTSSSVDFRDFTISKMIPITVEKQSTLLFGDVPGSFGGDLETVLDPGAANPHSLFGTKIETRTSRSVFRGARFCESLMVLGA